MTAVHDGRQHVGNVDKTGKKFTARNAAGKKLGAFKSLSKAVGSVMASRTTRAKAHIKEVR